MLKEFVDVLRVDTEDDNADGSLEADDVAVLVEAKEPFRYWPIAETVLAPATDRSFVAEAVQGSPLVPVFRFGAGSGAILLRPTA